MTGHPKTAAHPVDSALAPAVTSEPMNAAPDFAPAADPTPAPLRGPFGDALRSWLTRSPSVETRLGYARGLAHFFRFHSIPDGACERLAAIRPSHVAAWRDELLGRGYTNTAVSRKLAVLCSLFSSLRSYGPS